MFPADFPPPDNRDPAIILGQEAQPGEIPYQALLIELINNEPYICGGSLIAPNWVLTAAHCMNPEKGSQYSTVLMGGTLIANMPYQAQTIKRIRHESYDPDSFENDIALYQIPTPANNIGLSLVQLAPRDIGPVVDQSVRASGFGYISNQGPISDRLLKVNLRSLSNEECRARFPAGISIVSTHICAYWLTRFGEAVCSGDSGGPLIFNNVQVGLVSFGLNSGCTTGPQAFTRVSEFRDWIDRTMANNPV